MNKFLKSSFLTVLTLMTLSVSRPSQAALGAITGNPVLVTAGAYALGGSAAVVGGLIVYGKTTSDNSDSAAMTFAFTFFGVAVPLAIVGLGLLENEQGLAYNSLTESEAAKIGLSGSQLESYNAEVDQINALASYVDTQLSSMAKPTLKDSISIWDSVKDSVSPEAFTAMQKITAQLYKK